MKFFVTGVGGQLGHDVMNELLKRGHEGVGSDIQEIYSGVADGSAVTKAPYVALDITDKDAVEKVITEVNPDAVIHCAAWTAVDMAEDDDKVAKVRAINAGGTQNIADVCKKLNCKMTYISTDYVFDGQGTEPWQPDCKDYKPLNVYNNVIVAFNDSSKYVQISAGEIAIYNYGVSDSKKRAVFDQNGNHFYRDNYYVGKIGTNQWDSNNAHKGLVFDLETQGKYMAWAQRPTESASGYTTILCYSRANSIYTQAGLHLGCNMYGHGWILDGVDLRNCNANGYTTFTGTLPVVLEIHKTDNNGGIGWSYGNVYIKNGLITSIPS